MFDKETGSYYLRMRYMDPRTGRFTSEDPIKSGLNFYTYTASSPLAFVDPLGLALVLQGTPAEIEAMVNDIMRLTNDSIRLDLISDGNGSFRRDSLSVEIDDYWATGLNLPVGTALIRDLIWDDKTCTIQDKSYVPINFKDVEDNYTLALNKFGVNNPNRYPQPDGTPGEGANANVYLNLNLDGTHPDSPRTVWYEDDNGNYKVNQVIVPSYITMGHELIHALRAMLGVSEDLENKGSAFWNDGTTLQIEDKQKIEDYQTVGMASWSKNNGTFMAYPADSSPIYPITENNLMAEHPNDTPYRRLIY